MQIFFTPKGEFPDFHKKKVASRLCPSYRCKKEGETTLIFGGGDLGKVTLRSTKISIM